MRVKGVKGREWRIEENLQEVVGGEISHPKEGESEYRKNDGERDYDVFNGTRERLFGIIIQPYC